MGLFTNLKTDGVKVEKPVEAVSTGKSFGVVETGVYDCIITNAYVTVSKPNERTGSKGGAMAFNFELETTDKEVINQTIYVSSGLAKGQKSTYEKDGKTYFLPGYIMVNDIVNLLTGADLTELDTDDGLVEVYSFEAKARVKETFPIVTEIINKRIKLAIQKVVEDKYGSTTGETRELNEIIKAFDAEDEVTFAEAQAGKSGFMAKWLERNKGQIKDKTKAQSGAVAPAASPVTKTATASDEVKPASKLFNRG